MKLISKSVIAAQLVALCGLIVCSAAQAQSYRLTVVGPEADQSPTYPAAINRYGHVAGTSGELAFVGIGAKKDSLGSLPGGLRSRGFDLNNFDEVVGDSSTGNARVPTAHATLFSGGQAYDLGTLPGWGNASVATGINDRREIVGYTATAPSSEQARAFRWTPRIGMTDLGTLGGSYSQATAISENGHITGSSQLRSDLPARHAVLWKGSAIYDLGTLGGRMSYGTAVNDSGHVVGYSEINGVTKVDAPVHAFLFDGAQMRDLGSFAPATPESDRSYALGVNAADDVVGTTYRRTSNGKLEQIAFLYRNGRMFDLNTLTKQVGSSSFHLISATAINDGGQITAQAVNTTTGATYAVLLTTVSTR